METTMEQSGQGNRSIVEAYFGPLRDRNQVAIGSLLSDDVVEIIPLSTTGDPAPLASFTGKENVLRYVKIFFKNFHSITAASTWRQPHFNKAQAAALRMGSVAGVVLAKPGLLPVEGNPTCRGLTAGPQ
jgi:hypothetical protein